MFNALIFISKCKYPLFKWYASDAEPKFAADSAFAQRDFDAAEEHYRRALEATKGKTSSMKRDLMEGLCRTLLKTNKHQEALKWANELVRKVNKITTCPTETSS